MKTAVLVLALLFGVLVSAHADPQIASAQQALKDQGFYYGAVTGTKDADTTAAIRRYQIRNGLQITGELSAETRKSLGVGGSAAAPTATPAARSAPTAPPVRRATPPPTDTSDLRDDEPIDELDAEPEERAERFPSEPVPRPGYAPGPRGLYPDTSGLFEGTPYEVAPPDLQRNVILGAQMRLARQGYYRSVVDGIYGPGMAAALRAFQSQEGLEPTGALDMETLAALRLLPGAERRGMRRRQRILRPPVIMAPNGERIYEPRR